MKLKLLILGAIVGFSLTSLAQSTENKLAVGIYTGISDYRGELNQEWFNTKAYRTQFGATIMLYANPFLNAGIDVGYGTHGFHVDKALGQGEGYRADVLKANLQARLKFNNGKWMKEDAKFQPYLFAGLGLANTFEDAETPDLNVPGLDFTGNAGLGFNVMFTEKFGINYNLNWAYTNHDKRDNISNGKNDQFMIHSIGIVLPIGQIIDTDEDGVIDSRDKCPNTPAGVSVDLFGCPLDRDGDGVADYQDACPDVKGLPSMKGCPDTDGDGITDADDACPTVKGVASANGCPDADGDGIQDSEDACPKVKGIASMKGCPDTDGDGITDAEDKCPTVKGTKEFEGCPDTDGDGIPDNLDKCPKVAGVVANNGCPEIKAETQKVFDQALKGVQFETSKAIIKTTSYGILDNVAKIMKDNPSYNLDINGHTDSQGDDAKNMALSKERAASVKQYLVDKGVEASRMASYGFGEEQPKATNETAAGRAENRRVEFKVRF
jgi:OOP family OmpA-OmpF porin